MRSMPMPLMRQALNQWNGEHEDRSSKAKIRNWRAKPMRPSFQFANGRIKGNPNAEIGCSNSKFGSIDKKTTSQVPGVYRNSPDSNPPKSCVQLPAYWKRATNPSCSSS